MANYIDGFVLPLARTHLDEYKRVAEKVADIWKEYGALAYFEYVGEDLKLEGTRSFIELVDVKEDEAVIFGWVVFPSRAVRDRANQQVPTDPRMAEIIGPLTDPERMIFNAERMFYGGFQPLVAMNAGGDE
ncbi:MAG: DUF1428 family protein [Bacteroidetes bacterium]|jgi:uncharacterized protein YbaA (DUF1428 family)|nr:DUF1428 family protein [Bacteroidota bacterium]